MLHLVGCKEYGGIKFFHEGNQRCHFRSQTLAFWARLLAIDAMAQQGKGRGRRNRRCTHAQGQLNLFGELGILFSPKEMPQVKVIYPKSHKILFFSAITGRWWQREGPGIVGVHACKEH